TAVPAVGPLAIMQVRRGAVGLHFPDQPGGVVADATPARACGFAAAVETVAIARPGVILDRQGHAIGADLGEVEAGIACAALDQRSGQRGSIATKAGILTREIHRLAPG